MGDSIFSSVVLSRSAHRHGAQSPVELLLQLTQWTLARQGTTTAGRETNGLGVFLLVFGQERFPVQTFCSAAATVLMWFHLEGWDSANLGPPLARPLDFLLSCAITQRIPFIHRLNCSSRSEDDSSIGEFRRKREYSTRKGGCKLRQL